MKFPKVFVTILIFTFSLTVTAQKYKKTEKINITKDYKGATFNSNNSLVENLNGIEEFSIFTKSLSDESIQKLMDSNEMITVFVFTNSSFNDLPKKTKDSLNNSPQAMSNLLTYNMVAGRVDAHSLKTESEKNKTSITTLNSEKIGVMTTDKTVFLQDENGNKAAIEENNFYFNKGLFHIIKGVILPKSSKE